MRHRSSTLALTIIEVSGQPPVLVRLIRAAAPPPPPASAAPGSPPISSSDAGGAIIIGSCVCIGDLGEGGVVLPLPLRLPPPLLQADPVRDSSAAAAKTVALARLTSSPPPTTTASSLSSIMLRLMQQPAWRAYERDVRKRLK